MMRANLRTSEGRIMLALTVIALVIAAVAFLWPVDRAEQDRIAAPFDPAAAKSLALSHADVPAWYREAAGEAAAKGELYTWTWMPAAASWGRRPGICTGPQWTRE